MATNLSEGGDETGTTVWFSYQKGQVEILDDDSHVFRLFEDALGPQAGRTFPGAQQVCPLKFEVSDLCVVRVRQVPYLPWLGIVGMHNCFLRPRCQRRC